MRVHSNTVKDDWRKPSAKQTAQPCAGCGAAAMSCQTLRWLSGRCCCADCTHSPDVSRTPCKDAGSPNPYGED
jgi:hypothetical protein